MEDSDIQIGDKVKIIGATNFNDEKGIVVASKTIRGLVNFSGQKGIANNIVDVEYRVEFDNGDYAWYNSTEFIKLPKKLKQVTIRVEAFATVMVDDDWDDSVDFIPMKLEVFDCSVDETSPVREVNETDITAREVTHVVNINDL